MASGRRRSTRGGQATRIDRRSHRRRAVSRLVASARRASRRTCGPRPRLPSPTPRSGMRISRCWRPGCAPGLPTVAPYVARMTPQLLSVEAGAAPRTTWRCDSSMRTRGSVSRSSVRRCRTSACRCCCAGGTPSATRPTPRRSPQRSWRRPPPPASTSSGSSTHSTTSTRCGRPSTRCATPTPLWPRWRCRTPATSPTPARSLYTLDYYLRLAEQIVDAGAHVLAIKDMAGLLRPAAATTLVSALRSRFDLPVHVHTHDTPGGQLATYSRPGRRVWTRSTVPAPLAGTTSQPSLSSIVAATEHTDRDTGLDLPAVCDLEPYWDAVRSVYAPFDVAAAGAPRRRAGCTPMRSQVANCRICASRRSHWASTTDSKTSRPTTRARTGYSAD